MHGVTFDLITEDVARCVICVRCLKVFLHECA